MRIGYIGLGALGSELAGRFIPAHDLVVWDLSEEACERMSARGARVASSSELAHEADVLLLCLPRSDDVRDLLFGARGIALALRPGTLVIDQTSGDASVTREIAQRLAEQDVSLMDAAVSGSPALVAAGGATLMASGPDDTFERAMPVLRTITESIHRCGRNVGDGQTMKTVNNAVYAACCLGTLELAALAAKAGLDLASLTELFNRGKARNLTTEKMLPAILAGRAATNFALALMLKDLNLAVSLGLAHGTPMPIVDATRSLLQIGVNLLGPRAKLDDMIEIVARLSGARFEQEPAQEREAVTGWNEAQVGFVGLTEKSVIHARALMRSCRLHVHADRSGLAERLATDGAAVVADLTELARACDVIVLYEPDVQAKREVLFGAQGLASGLSAGSIVIDLAQHDWRTARTIEAELGLSGVAVLDLAAVDKDIEASGTSGNLLVSGSPDAFECVKSILTSLAPDVAYCGSTGSAQVARILEAALFAVGLFASTEGLLAGVSHGLPLVDVCNVINGSSGHSAASKELLPALTNDDKEGARAFHLRVADLQNAASLSAEYGTSCLVLNAVRTLAIRASIRFGDPISTIDAIRLYEEMTDIELRVDHSFV
ncbi:NAD(P)-binding domain-containing protein [Caballeronia sp. GAWG1-1]|uniref:NAD(P)-binding domain-containing protein n=1 Tax=Caballeronia sp. GAWG1-1 TaxID=2921742 RepID=UPI00202938F2|nr:NAD(P)-binding domain-containing protein [Caballeronia sp. GAWG1-1]